MPRANGCKVCFRSVRIFSRKFHPRLISSPKHKTKPTRATDRQFLWFSKSMLPYLYFLNWKLGFFLLLSSSHFHAFSLVIVLALRTFIVTIGTRADLHGIPPYQGWTVCSRHPFHRPWGDDLWLFGYSIGESGGGTCRSDGESRHTSTGV